MAMNSVESAASLFELDDASPDPFAVIGDDAEPTIHSTNDVHGETLAAVDPSSPSAAAVNVLDLKDPSSGAQYGSELELTSQDPYTYSDTFTYPHDTGNSGSYSDEQVQGWYDEHGQRQMHEYLPVQAAETSEHFPYRCSTLMQTS